MQNLRVQTSGSVQCVICRHNVRDVPAAERTKKPQAGWIAREPKGGEERGRENKKEEGGVYDDLLFQARTLCMCMEFQVMLTSLLSAQL